MSRIRPFPRPQTGMVDHGMESLHYDQWKLSVKSEIHTSPLPDETSTDETTPKPDEPRPRL